VPLLFGRLSAEEIAFLVA